MQTDYQLTNLLQEDLKLFESIALGDRKSFEGFYIKYYKHLCRFAMSYEEDIYIVEEKVSDVFYYLWNNREELNTIHNPKVYVFTMTKNLLFQYKKKQKYRCNSVLQDLSNNQCLGENIEDSIIFNEHQQLLKKQMVHIISMIPARSKQVFEMSRIDGLKYQQIAQILNISIKTVESHMSCAMRSIEKALNKFST